MASRDGPRPYRVTITRWVDADGRRATSKTPGARAIRTESRTYYADLIVDNSGRTKRVALKTAILSDAWVELRRLQRERGYRLRDVRPDEHAETPIGDHIGQWIAALRQAGETAESRLELIEFRVRRLATEAGWHRLHDVTADSCAAALSRMMKATRSISAQTRNHYLSHGKQFIRWVWTSGRMSSHPLLGLKPISVEGRLRRERRCPTTEEIAALFAALAQPDAPTRRGMTAPHRALTYRVMMATGFRLSEVRSLERDGIDLDAGTLTVRAGYSKRRRTDTQHVPPWLVSELRAWLAAGGPLFSGLPRGKPAAKTLKADLKAAGVPYVVKGPDGPLYFDHHSLRHYYITSVASLPGIDLKTLLQLTRHSTPELTLKVYARHKVELLRAAVDKLSPP